jgi:dCTP deaminase
MGLLINGELKKMVLADPPLVFSPDDSHPFDLEVQLQPASIDLRLSNQFQRFKSNLPFLDCIDDQSQSMEFMTIEEFEPLVLKPGDFLLAQTVEHVNIANNMVGKVEARQSIARLGIMVNLASNMNPGYEGIIPLQLINLSPHSIVLRPYWRICTLMIEQCDSPVEKPYGEHEDAKYQDEEIISPSKLAYDVEIYNKIIKNEDVLADFSDSILKMEIETNLEFKSYYSDMFRKLTLECLYLCKARGHTWPEQADIDDARRNIEKILKTTQGGP